MVLSVGGRDRRPKTVKSFLPLNLVTNDYGLSEVRPMPEWVRVFGLNPEIELGSVRQDRVIPGRCEANLESWRFFNFFMDGWKMAN